MSTNPPLLAKGPAPQAEKPKPSSGVSSLELSCINLLSLRESAKNDLTEILDEVKGGKGLVIDPRFSVHLEYSQFFNDPFSFPPTSIEIEDLSSRPLGLVTEVATLKQHGVEKIYLLNTDKLHTECKNLIYFVRPDVSLMQLVIKQIKGHFDDQFAKKAYYLYFVPRRNYLCEKMLEESGIDDDIKIGEFALDTIPMDDDLISMEMENAFRDCFLLQDRTTLHYLAQSLIRIQQIFGVIPQIRAKGVCSKIVAETMMKMRKDMTTEMPSSSDIDQIILIDRDVDYVTPLVTQLTYQGLVDEIFGIVHGYIDVDPKIVGDTKTEAATKKIALNSNDSIYRQLRDLNFSQVPAFLSKKTKEISKYYEQRKDIPNKNPSALQEFVKQFAEARKSEASVTIHSGLTEQILSQTDSSFYNTISTEQDLLAGAATGNDFIEECINKQEPIFKVLRLLCLQSITSGGLKQKEYEFFKTEILQTYGYNYLPALVNLERLGLLRISQSSTFGVAQALTGGNWGNLRKNFNLIVNGVEKNMSDMAYVYSIYAPLSARLVQAAFQKGGWKAKEDAMKLLPGPTIEESQVPLKGSMNKPFDQRVTLVYFIGGVTFAEISAIKWLEEQGYGNFVIGSTKFINGNSMMKSFIDTD